MIARLLRFMAAVTALSAAWIILALAAAPLTSPGWEVVYASRADNGYWRLHLLSIDRQISQPILRRFAFSRTAPVVSPDRRFVVWGESITNLQLYDTRTGVSYELGSASLPSWSPDSRRLAYRAGPGIFVITLDTAGIPGSPIMIHSAPESLFLVWSPDSTSLAFERIYYSRNGDIENSDIVVINPDTLALRILNHDPQSINFSLAWSPDGAHMAYVSRQGLVHGLYVVNADGSAPRLLLEAPINRMFTNLAWSPDGQRLAFTAALDGPSAIYVVDVYAGDSQRIPVGPLGLTQSGASPVWSPDGRRIAFVSGSTRDIYVVNTATRGLRRLTDDDHYHVLAP